MSQPVRIVGSYASPYVRKVLVVLDLKGISYEIDPIVPFMGNDAFSKLSPVRRIPVLIDDAVTLTDSTVICEYLDDRHPTPAVRPTGAVPRARARWLEEFADTRMGEVFIWRLFNQVAINPVVWGIPTDQEILSRTLQEDIPHVLDYLESEIPAAGFLFGEISVADISIATFFRNAAFARYRVDAARWPMTASFVDRVLAIESFTKLKPFEDTMMRTPPTEQRAALAKIGAPLTAETYGTPTPRRGLMKI
ncbi:MAG: glutathione S-transferase family protein [Candidatus Binatia bacterium]